MLNGYTKLSNEVIFQSDLNCTMKYDDDYIQKSYKEDAMLNIAYLRFGFLLGAGVERGSILDVGYGFGHFLKLCKKFGFDTYGIEVNQHDISDFAKKGSFDQHYDTITFFDSLEHFQSINFVKDLKCKNLIISLPWCHYFNDDWFKNWKHRKYGEHLWHFSEIALKNFLSECGFEVTLVSNVEDSLRTPVDSNSNILTVVAKRL
jgi:2-polyprenyl-3-methyl-5-hydroxy-6-metoxy-1,4-benzoquinol methylase